MSWMKVCFSAALSVSVDFIWIRAGDDAYLAGENILCKILVSDSLLGKDSFRKTVQFQ